LVLLAIAGPAVVLGGLQGTSQDAKAFKQTGRGKKRILTTLTDLGPCFHSKLGQALLHPAPTWCQRAWLDQLRQAPGQPPALSPMRSPGGVIEEELGAPADHSSSIFPA